MSRTPPPLDPSISFRSLELFLAADPTVMLLQQEQEKAEVESMHEQREDQLAVQEEADYQQAVSNSLGLSYIVPASPAPLAPSASGSGLHGALPTVIPTVRTVPYCPPKITQHLNDNWMRPTQDNTPKARKVVRKPNLDNRFTIIFWGKVRSPSNCGTTLIDVGFRMIVLQLFGLFMNVLNGQNGFSWMHLTFRRILASR